MASTRRQRSRRHHGLDGRARGGASSGGRPGGPAGPVAPAVASCECERRWADAGAGMAAAGPAARPDAGAGTARRCRWGGHEHPPGIARRRPLGLVEAIGHEVSQPTEGLTPAVVIPLGRQPIVFPGPCSGPTRPPPLAAWTTRVGQAIRLALVGDAGLVEGGHLGQHPGGGLDQRERQGRAGALAQAQAEVEQRGEPESASTAEAPGSTERWPAMTPSSTPGTSRLATSSADAGDHAVDHDRDLQGGGAGDEARPAPRARARRPRRGSPAASSPCRCRARSAAAATSSVLRRSRSSSMPVPRPVTPDAGRSVRAAIRADGGRGVGDAHVAGDQAARPVSDQTGGDLGADVEGPLGLVDRHGRSDGEVCGAGPHLAHQEAGHLGQLRATPTSTTTTSAPAWRARTLIAAPPATKLRHHLRRDLLRPRRDALGVHAVVAGEHRDHRGAWQRRREHGCDAGELRADGFQSAQRSGWLGEPELVLLRSALRLDVQRRVQQRRRPERAGPAPPARRTRRRVAGRCGR